MVRRGSFIPLSSLPLLYASGSLNSRWIVRSALPDEDMVAMYLADQRMRPVGVAPREEKDHGEIELLLESVQRQVEEIVNEVETTIVSPDTLFIFPHERIDQRASPLTLLYRRSFARSSPTFNRPRRSLSSSSMQTGISCSDWICRCASPLSLSFFPDAGNVGPTRRAFLPPSYFCRGLGSTLSLRSPSPPSASDLPPSSLVSSG